MKQEVTDRKKTNLFIILSGIFITNALIAEIIGVKIFSLENTFGLNPAQIPLLGDFRLDFNLTAGAIIWPVVFVSTDIINEYFGKKGVRKISYIAAGLIAYSFFIIFIATKIAPADFWLEINSKDPQGNYFDADFAFNKIFTQGLGIIIGSLTAFLVGQIVDVYVFHRIRQATGKNMIWLRATGSTLVSQLIDSFVVLFIAFYLLAGENRWSLPQLFSVGIINYIYKFTVALLLTPLLYVAHTVIDKYLGVHNADRIIEDANTQGYQP